MNLLYCKLDYCGEELQWTRQTRGFRSAIFGGFNREDVMHYIEETDTKYYTETAELRSQLTEGLSPR